MTPRELAVIGCMVAGVAVVVAIPVLAGKAQPGRASVESTSGAPKAKARPHDKVLEQLTAEFGQRLLASHCSLRQGGIVPPWGECRNFRFQCAVDHPLSESDPMNGISRKITLYTKYVARDAVNPYWPNNPRPWGDHGDYYNFEIHTDGTWKITMWDTTAMYYEDNYCDPGPGVTIF